MKFLSQGLLLVAVHLNKNSDTKENLLRVSRCVSSGILKNHVNFASVEGLVLPHRVEFPYTRGQKQDYQKIRGISH